MGFEKIKRPVKSPYFRAVSSGVQTTGPATFDNTVTASSNLTVTKTLTASSALTATKTLTASSNTALTKRVTLSSGLRLPVQALTTGGTISAVGITTLTASTTRTYTMSGPGVAGLVKEIYCISATTTNTATVSFSGATGSTGFYFLGTTGGANTTRKATFNASNEALLLRSVSSLAWAIAGNINSVALATT